ncbi:MAG TPA: IscS subfamily cysteine desulfurase, partial [Saprospiraceae bacterium]|nr:IscS subfamily cysteine desulfurase [Saprospiraceae bacterium]
AMGLTEPQAKSCIRISYGRYTTLEELQLAVHAITKGVEKVRSESPKWQMFRQGMDLSEY